MSLKPIKRRPKILEEYKEDAERLRRLREIRRRKSLEALEAREKLGLQPTERQKEDLEREIDLIEKKRLLKRVLNDGESDGSEIL